MHAIIVRVRTVTERYGWTGCCRYRIESGDADVVAPRCVIHLLRNSFRYASKRDWPAPAKDLKPVYSAPTEAAALGPAGRLRRHLGSPLPGDRAAGERHGLRALPDRAGRLKHLCLTNLQPRPHRPPAADQPLEGRTPNAFAITFDGIFTSKHNIDTPFNSTALRWGTLQHRRPTPCAQGWRADASSGSDSLQASR